MHRISVLLNRQQLELIDRSVAAGVAAGRAELLKQALHEFMARQPQRASDGKPPTEPRP